MSAGVFEIILEAYILYITCVCTCVRFYIYVCVSALCVHMHVCVMTSRIRRGTLFIIIIRTPCMSSSALRL